MPLDTHKAVKMLTEVGFDEPQAEAVVTTVGNAFDDTVATKTDIAELHAEIQAVRAELKSDIQEVHAELKSDIQEVRAEIRALEQRMTIKMGGFLAAAIGLITALNKLID